MIAWLHRWETSLGQLVAVASLLLEAISVFCVLLGLIKTLQLAIRLIRRPQPGILPFNRVRLRFGLWLALALEFQLGADILSTTVAPTQAELVRLALIAVIRTFLNYFLSQELKVELELEKEKITQSLNNPLNS